MSRLCLHKKPSEHYDTAKLQGFLVLMSPAMQARSGEVLLYQRTLVLCGVWSFPLRARLQPGFPSEPEKETLNSSLPDPVCASESPSTINKKPEGHGG